AGVGAGLEGAGDDGRVAAQRIEALGLRRRRDRELAAVPGGAVVVEDDLSIEVFEAGHGGSRIRWRRTSRPWPAIRREYRRRFHRCTRTGTRGWWPERPARASAASDRG